MRTNYSITVSFSEVTNRWIASTAQCHYQTSFGRTPTEAVDRLVKRIEIS